MKWQRCIFTVTSSPHRHSHSEHHHVHPHADPVGDASSVTRIQRLAMFLEAHFGEVQFHMPDEDEAEQQDEEDEEEGEEGEGDLELCG